MAPERSPLMQAAAHRSRIVLLDRGACRKWEATLMRLLVLSVALSMLIPPDIGRANMPIIESGFHSLYETRFHEARAQFQAWELANPQNPLGYAFEASSYLFEEFYQQGILTSAFFLDDKKFLQGISTKPDQARRALFLRAVETSQALASRRLAENPRDAEALFALTLTAGMMADYTSLLDKKQIESLKFIRKSESYAQKLLAVKPDAADAYLAVGSANYIIGSLPIYKRAVLWLGGIKGDRKLGIAQLTVAADRGDYLRPFAKILLALIDLRERQIWEARREFEELAVEFPQNPLFVHELDLLDHARK
jgi:hypothetical protein